MNADLARRLGLRTAGAARVAGGCVGAAYRAEDDSGQAVFVKTHPPGGAELPAGMFTAEAAGLKWLAAAGPAAVPVPQVLAVSEDALVLQWVTPAAPTVAAAEQFGAALAATHAAGADAFGAADPGFIGTLPMDNTPAPTWAQFYAQRRVLPYLRRAVDRGAICSSDARAVDELADRMDQVAGPAEPPARIHGDLWSGNLHWSTTGDRNGQAWLIDPAAHGGHRETDLAMLALFGAPHLEVILAAYVQAWPPADGWRERVPLHQLHPVLVHAGMFGGGYGARAGALARAALRA